MVELIGVLAIVAVLAMVIAPNVIKKLDAAASDAERESLEGIADAIEAYLSDRHQWPPTLAALSPDYLPVHTRQIVQNTGGFPRYFIVHPHTQAFDNAQGLSPGDLKDARYLLISQLDSDPAPIVTNAAEFTSWWRHNEQATPNLHIVRRHVSDRLGLLALGSNGMWASYSIDGQVTNWDCRRTASLIHERYHLHGTSVLLDEAATFDVPEVQVSHMDDIGFRYDACDSAGSRWRREPSANPRCWSVWLTTQQNVAAPSQVSCLASWTDTEVLQFSHPSLTLEPGVTNGTISSVVPFNDMVIFGSGRVAAIHHVSTDVSVGQQSPVSLSRGDIILSYSSSAIFRSINFQWVGPQDVFVFRPTSPRDYASGTFLRLFRRLTLSVGNRTVTAVSLVERTTRVGDAILEAGAVLYADSRNNIILYEPDRVGNADATGTHQTLIAGNDLDIDPNIEGIELVERDMHLEGVTVPSGTLLISLASADDNIGDNHLAVAAHDVVMLETASTTLTSGRASAQASLLIEGADAGLSQPSQAIGALALAPML